MSNTSTYLRFPSSWVHLKYALLSCRGDWFHVLDADLSTRFSLHPRTVSVVVAASVAILVGILHPQCRLEARVAASVEFSENKS